MPGMLQIALQPELPHLHKSRSRARGKPGLGRQTVEYRCPSQCNSELTLAAGRNILLLKPVWRPKKSTPADNPRPTEC